MKKSVKLWIAAAVCVVVVGVILLDYMNSFYTDLVETIEANKETGLADELKEEKLCPNCGKNLVVRRSRFGKLFYGCAGFPQCRTIVNID